VWPPIVLFLISFLIYALTAANEPMNIADANDFITAAYKKGVAHPPSYPLYVTMLHLMMRLPLPLTTAHVANLTSAFLQSLSLVVFYFCSIRLLEVIKIPRYKYFNVYASILGSLTLGFSYFYWEQATIAEIFGMANVFTGLVLLLFLYGYYKKSPTLFFGTLGLAAGRHQLVLLLVPALFLHIKPDLKLQEWIKGTTSFLVAFFLPYTLLFTFFDHNARLSWYFEPSVAGIWDLISRGVYKHAVPIEAVSKSVSLSHLTFSMTTLVYYLVNHISLSALLISFLGIVALRKFNKPLFIFFLTTLLISGPMLAIYMRFPMASESNDQMLYQGTYLKLRMFFLLEYMIGLLIPIGFAYLFGRISFQDKKSRLIIYAFLMVIPLSLIAKNYTVVNKRDRNFDREFYNQILVELPPNSVLITDSDYVFGLLYNKIILNTRPDILLLPTAMHMRWGYLQNILPSHFFNISGYYELVLSLVDWGITTNRPVFAVSPSQKFLNQIAVYGYTITPYGYSMEISKTPTNRAAPYDYSFTRRIITRKTDANDLWTRGKMGELTTLHSNMAFAYARLEDMEKANYHLNFAKQLVQEGKKSQEFIEQVEMILQEKSETEKL